MYRDKTGEEIRLNISLMIRKWGKCLSKNSLNALSRFDILNDRHCAPLFFNNSAKTQQPLTQGSWISHWKRLPYSSFPCICCLPARFSVVEKNSRTPKLTAMKFYVYKYMYINTDHWERTLGRTSRLIPAI